MYLRTKRTLDFGAAALALIVLSPLLAIVAIAILLTMGRPAIFRQERIGWRNRVIRVSKFRTMRDASDAHGHPLPDAKRLTSFGCWMRSSSIDELPQLWNVLTGDMSLVGPRPLLPHYLPRYSVHQRRRHEVRPGITGWAQVNGRNALSWGQRFELDVWYVDHQNFWLDLKILWMTVLKVIRRDGISQSGHATMPEFMGSSDRSRTVYL